MNLPEIEKSLLPWIGKTGKMLGLFAMDKFKKHHLNLSVEQWVVLKMLHDEDGRVQNAIAHITNRNKTTLTRLINTMEKNNLVARISDKEDKRINRIFLTKNGRKTFQNTLPVMKECIDELQEGISENEIKTLIRIIKKVQKNLLVE